MKRALAVFLVALVTLFAGGGAAIAAERDWLGGPPDCC
jgi:hypothetical protein